MHNMQRRKLTKNRVLELLDEEIKKVENLLERADSSEMFDDPDYLSTYYDIEQTIFEVFSEDELKEFRRRLEFSLGNSGTKKGNEPSEFRPTRYTLGQYQEHEKRVVRGIYKDLYKSHLKHLIAMLKSYEDKVKKFYEDGPASQQ